MSDPSTAYRVLARTYRPSDFSSLIGQDAMVRTLKNAIDSGRLAHAFVLTGVRGVGKTTTARIIAKALNCIGPDGQGGPTIEPCGVCDNCLGIAESRHPDVMEMDAASRTGVDDIREIIDGVRYAPTSARYKVYIIDEVHMLSKNAFNALLKTLEEPPPHVKFIFATTEIRKLPVTVLSRCQRFDLKRIPADLLIAHLRGICEKEQAEVSDGALALIARASEGSVRDSLSLLDQAIAHSSGAIDEEAVRAMLGLADRARTIDLFRAVMSGDVAAALSILREQYDAGAEPSLVVEDLMGLVHWLTRLKIVPDAGSDMLVSQSEREQGGELASGLAMTELTRAWQILVAGHKEVDQAALPIQAAEMLIVRLAYAAQLPSPADLVAKLKDAKPEAFQGSAATASAPPVSAPVSEAPLFDPSPTPEPPQPSPETANHGNTVVALRPETHPPQDGPLDAMPTDFADLVRLVEDRREAQLVFALEEQVRLVSYQPGRLVIQPEKGLDQTVPTRLRVCLKEWTGRDWDVVVANEGGGATLREQLVEAETQQLEAARRDPVVASVLATFPGAELTHIETPDD